MEGSQGPSASNSLGRGTGTEREREAAAAIAIQARVRGFQARKHLLQDRQIEQVEAEHVNLQQGPGLARWPEVLRNHHLLPELDNDRHRVLQHLAASKTLRVFAATWNMAGKAPPSDVSALLPLGKFHLIAVASQEAERSIQASTFNARKDAWEATLDGRLVRGTRPPASSSTGRKTAKVAAAPQEPESSAAGAPAGPATDTDIQREERLKADLRKRHYVRVASHALQATHIAVYAHVAVLPLLSDVQTEAVPCGYGNAAGNKGGVAVSMTVGATSLLFVSCHLSAGQKAFQRRLDDWNRIDRVLSLHPSGTAPPKALQQGEGEQQEHASRCSDRFDRVVWMGDLNFRVDVRRAVADHLLGEENYPELLAREQLRRAMASAPVAPCLRGFGEAPLNFKPTYKFDKLSGVYDSGPKQRVPSWTDRVLVKPADTRMRVCSYYSVTSMRHSDHRPVAASVLVRLRGHGSVAEDEASCRCARRWTAADLDFTGLDAVATAMAALEAEAPLPAGAVEAPVVAQGGGSASASPPVAAAAGSPAGSALGPAGEAATDGDTLRECGGGFVVVPPDPYMTLVEQSELRDAVFRRSVPIGTTRAQCGCAVM